MTAFPLFHRQALIQLGRKANTVMDKMFYDVTALSSEEKSRLSAWTQPEGSVVTVYPKHHERGIETLTPLAFITERKKKNAVPIDTLVVAGIGSSALGTAALARNVADVLNRPVAGIVSGMGVADLISEALGGWFVLGVKNTIRDGFAKWFDFLDMKDHVWEDTSYQTLVKDDKLDQFDFDQFVFGSPDATALLLILYHLRTKIKCLVGHSKGNYIIENALEGLAGLCRVKKQKLPKTIKVVTLGTVVRFPDQFEHIEQFIGQLDVFGMLNSRAYLDSHWVDGAWHTLNTAIPGNLAVAKALKSAGAA